MSDRRLLYESYVIKCIFPVTGGTVYFNDVRNGTDEEKETDEK